MVDGEPMTQIAGDDMQGFATMYRPPLRVRFWRKLGFRSRVPNMPEDAETMPGWAMTTVHLHLGFGDRLRFLLSGWALVRVEQRFDAEVGRVVSASSVEIVIPWSPSPAAPPDA